MPCFDRRRPSRTPDLGISDMLDSARGSRTSDFGIPDFDRLLRTQRAKSDFGLGISDFISTSHQIESRQSQGNPPHPLLLGLGLSDSDFPYLCLTGPLFLWPSRVGIVRLSDLGFRTRTKLIVAQLLRHTIMTASGQRGAHMRSGSCHVRSCKLGHMP